MREARPRIPPELTERIDGVRGNVPFERWVRQALETALGERPGTSTTGSGAATIRRSTEAAAVTTSTSSPDLASPRAPAPRRKTSPLNGQPRKPPVSVERVAERALGVERPTPVQLSGRNGVPVAVARRWLESGEWELYWP